MPVTIKVADLEKDRDIMIATLNNNRGQPSDEKRYNWLYKNNPYGEAKAWLVIDDSSGEVAGFTAAFPRAMRVVGQDLLCWNLGDFSINKKYRSLGVAIKLRKAARQDLENGEIPFYYAHPNNAMLIVHLKAGHKVIGEIPRYAKLLRLNEKVYETLGNRFIANGISIIANPVLRHTSKERSFRGKFDIDIRANKDDCFDEEFTSLYDEVRDMYKVLGVRSAQYLNWKYCDNPLYDTETMMLRDNGKMVGYAIYLIKNGFVEIKDLFCAKHREIMEHLVAGLILELRERGIFSISITLLDSNPFIEILESFGFRMRSGTSSAVAYANTSREFSNIILNGENWFMMEGDRDL